MRRKVSGTGQKKIPENWSDFFCDPNNKKELFQFLSDKVSCTDCLAGRKVFVTSGATVVSRATDRSMPLCNHEEADTRIVHVVHLLDALENGCSICLVRTVDRDVVAILIGKYHSKINKHPTTDIWVAFGTGKNFM